MNPNTMHTQKNRKRNKKRSGNNNPLTEINTGLNITLKRQVKTKRYPIVAQLTFKRERPDLVSLLGTVQRNPKAMPDRLKAYIQREKLWDSETLSLTAKGEDVIKTGHIDVKERGLYHIWYTDNDPLLGTRPLLIQRDTAFAEPSYECWKSGTDARNSEFKVSIQSPVNVLEAIYEGRNTTLSQHSFTLVSLVPEVLCSAKASAILDLEWQLGFAQSKISLKGQLESLNLSRSNTNSEVRNFEGDFFDFEQYLPNLLKVIADKFNGLWDEKTQRIGVEMEKIYQYHDALQTFEIKKQEFSDVVTAQGTFNSAQIARLPIRPINQNEALRWQKTWLNTFHSQNYHNSADARDKQSQWLDHMAIADFNLPLKRGQELLECFTRDKQPKSYWHVAAIEDLSPSSIEKQKLPITLVNSETFDIRHLIRQLTNDALIHRVIYSDRYVHTNKQISNLNNIASNFKGTEGLLMTLNNSKEKRSTAFPANWVVKHFDKQSDNHGRYWIFIGASYTWCWECTSGLDFICNTDKGCIVDGTPSFIPKNETELPSYLQQTINKIRTVEAV